jgi:hypothetical protein
VHARAALLVAAAVACALLAGCSESPAATLPAPTPVSTGMAIVGLVQDENLVPVPGANVTLRLVGRGTTTDGQGNFHFDGLAPSAYLVDVDATGYEPATLTAEPRAAANASLNFVLRRPLSLRPSVAVEHYRGILQCALEAVIISPSCDSILTVAPGSPHLFNDTSAFDLGVNRNWGTVVADVDFDAAGNPGLDGLRLVVRGLGDGDQFGDYQQFGRFNASAPFTVRLQPGGAYPDGTGPLPGNTTLFRFEVYPQSHGWHATCAAACLLGAGAGLDVTFDLYVSVFYNQEAPAGYTLLGGH